jgi:hypothetical protein
MRQNEPHKFFLPSVVLNTDSKNTGTNKNMNDKHIIMIRTYAFKYIETTPTGIAQTNVRRFKSVGHATLLWLPPFQGPNSPNWWTHK